MPRAVGQPGASELRADGTLPGGWWHDDDESGRVVCDLCPRTCRLKDGDRGFCFVRQNSGGAMVLTTYGRSTGFCIDPIEKKPLNHFYPGTSVLSFGTAGCNLGCKFCQNWDISKSREVERLSELATPEAIANAALQHGCRSVAFTYNDPIIWAEYAMDTARACRAVGVKTVAVTAGYISPEARAPFFHLMDAANVDLKGFTEEFYHHITYSHLQPVLDTLEWLAKESDTWFEITNLVIPGANDAMDDIKRMCGWILERVGAEVPVHFTAFHPDFRMRDRPNTPHQTLLDAYSVARNEGLKHVYVGNVNDVKHQSTYCSHCESLVIERDWYALGAYQVRGNRCGRCGGTIAGRFDERPGNWGRKRLPIEIARFAPAKAPAPTPNVITPDQLSASMKPNAPEIDPQAAVPEAHDAGPVALSDEQRQNVLAAAAEFVAAAIQGRAARLNDPTLAGAADQLVGGAYVTLKRRGHLRACCGFLGTPKPLIEALQHAAFLTVTEDHRLPAISPSELPHLDLSVNLLHGLKRVTEQGASRVDAVEAGRHGLRIQRGSAGGLLLPVVAVENGWDSETFLRQLCRKGGLPSNAWEDDESMLHSFEGLEFGGPFDANAVGQGSSRSLLTFSPNDLRQMAAHARANIVALFHGMTPNYYMFGILDGTVSGLALTIRMDGAAEPMHLVQISMRPGMPLQATLFRLCEAAARTVRPMSGSLDTMHVGVTVFSDPALHGTVQDPDLRGLDPAQRALMIIEQDKSAWGFSPARDSEALFASVRCRVEIWNPDRAAVFSLAAQSTENEIVFESAPKAIPASGTRRPSAAGTFYPADAAELAQTVDEMLGASERKTETWRAVMVPHAGLRFSGQLAASVFNRVAIPELVIVIGPKHSRNGVDWAISPYDSWYIPGVQVAADPAVARALTNAIPGLHRDAAAHEQEHAIEVELPFLARLAPESRVVGIAVGAGNWEHCQRFAQGLAEVIRGLPKPPLLVISSDMNHYATDRENRGLDELALGAMERLDPAHLLSVVTDHNISMCGVLPAVIVMETLRLLGGLQTIERVGYSTSADVTGDKSRVVGYAGVLLN